MTKYRVTYQCHNCGKIDTTQAKRSLSSPARCSDCGSSYTRKIDHEVVQ